MGDILVQLASSDLLLTAISGMAAALIGSALATSYYSFKRRSLEREREQLERIKEIVGLQKEMLGNSGNALGATKETLQIIKDIVEQIDSLSRRVDVIEIALRAKQEGSGESDLIMRE